MPASEHRGLWTKQQLVSANIQVLGGENIFKHIPFCFWRTRFGSVRAQRTSATEGTHLLNCPEQQCLLETSKVCDALNVSDVISDQEATNKDPGPWVGDIIIVPV